MDSRDEDLNSDPSTALLPKNKAKKAENMAQDPEFK